MTQQAQQPGTELATTPPRRTRGEAGTFERFDAPRPGTYWRARRDIDEQYDERRQTDEVDAGTVLLLTKVEAADGEPLVYHFAAHPGLVDGDPSRFHADDFYDCFEPAPDGDAVRQQELLALLREMDETKALMMAPPPDSAPAGLLTHDPAEQVGLPGQELVTRDQVQAMMVHAERLKEDAERRSNWITTHSETLGEQAKTLASFHQERATAALARAHDQLEGVKSILRTAENLRLYTGEGVDLMALRDGAPAAPAAPITIYQDVLSFDEETLILLDEGGADHTKVEAIVDALADPALLARIIPAERGMTLVQFRAKSKEFVREQGDNDLAARLYNAEMSRESKRLRLLVRDGDRLSLLDIPDVLDGISQLMPSAGEQDEYFLKEPAWHERDKGPRRITREDLEFASRRRAQMGALDRYGQVLIALWGLYDRGQIFTDGGPMPRFANWLDPVVQNQCLRLVSLDTLLGESRPSYAEWRDEQNRYFAPGCMVVVQASHFHDSAHLPAAFTNGQYPSVIFEFADKAAYREGLIGRVQADTNGLYLSVHMLYKGYNRDVRRRSIDAKLYLQFHEDKRVSDHLLVIDRAHAADLSYYLQSRRQRRAYANYVPLFQMAREAVQARDIREAPLRAAMLDALRAGRIPHDPETVERQVTEAIAVARTARKAQEIPEVDTPAFRSFMDAALDALHAAATGDSAKIAAVEAWAAAHQRQPLRLVLSGKRRYRLYLVPTEAEHDGRLGAPLHAAVLEVTFAKDGSITTSATSRELLRARTSEMVIRDWNWEEAAKETSQPVSRSRHAAAPRPAGATAWATRKTPYRASYAAATEALDMGRRQSAWFESGIDPDALAQQANSFTKRASKGSVVRMRLTFAIGSSLHTRYDGDTAPAVLFASVDAWHYAYKHGSSETREKIRQMIAGIYRRPDTHLAALGKDQPGDEWLVLAAGVDQVTKQRDRDEANGEWFGSRFDHEDLKSRKDRPARIRVTSITAAGARLFPELLAVAERGLDP